MTGKFSLTPIYLWLGIWIVIGAVAAFGATHLEEQPFLLSSVIKAHIISTALAIVAVWKRHRAATFAVDFALGFWLADHIYSIFFYEPEILLRHFLMPIGHIGVIAYTHSSRAQSALAQRKNSSVQTL